MPDPKEKGSRSVRRSFGNSEHFTERTGSLRCGFRRLSLPFGGSFGEQASFCVLKLRRASLTVESVLAIPVLLFSLITLISFMDVYRIQTGHLTALCQEAVREGIDAWPSGSDDDITKTDTCYYTPLRLLVPLPEVSFQMSVTVHPWTGSDSSLSGPDEGAEPEEMVYVTASGSVIHKDPHCSYLDIHIHAVPGASIEWMQTADGDKYHACEHCSRGKSPKGVVYITDNGTSYHISGTCSSLKRTVMLIPESAAEGYALCSRCGNG